MPQVWYEKLHQFLIHFGFTSSKCNHSLFIYNHNNITLYALVYVGDTLVTWSWPTLLHNLISEMHDNFSLKKLGIPQYFLGIEVHYQANGYMVIIQTKYIKDLLVKVNMAEANGVSTHMFISCKLRSIVKIKFQILCFTNHQYEHYNMLISYNQTLYFMSTKQLNLCLTRWNLIGVYWNVCFVTWVVRLLKDSH